MIDLIKHLIGDLARPFAIWWTAGAAGVAIVRLARPDTDLSGAAVYIGAVLAGVAALYVGKAWEVAKTGKQSADVEIAKAKTETG